jgi:hypothetical protein
VRIVKLADRYSVTDMRESMPGRESAPSNLVEYPMQIMSLQSDAQEIGGLEQDSAAYYYINAAMMMLSRMISEAEGRSC